MNETEKQAELSEAEAKLQAVVLQKEELASLTRSIPWGMLVAFVEDQTRRRMNEIMLTPVSSGSEAAEQNFKRGECAGLQMVKRFMEEELQVSKDTVELYRQALNERNT